MSALVVISGYSFGDHRSTARWHASCRDTERLVVWNPAGTAGMYLSRLRRQLLDNEPPISDGQVIVEQVLLPDADAVRRLGDATTAGASR